MIDENTVKLARSADIIVFLETYLGFTFEICGSSYRSLEHPSLVIKKDRLSWYWHSYGLGGFGSLDWLMHMEHKSFRVAVETVLNTQPSTASQTMLEPAKMLILPKERPVPVRFYHYLCDLRGIHRGIVETLHQEKKLYEDCRGNIVFVGHDDTGAARFASLRGTYDMRRFRRDCIGSDKRFGFHMVGCKKSDQVTIYESPLDAMSHASILNVITADPDAWKRDSRLSLAGTSDMALPFFLHQHPDVRELVLCLDNDPAGHAAADRIAKKYSALGYLTRLELPLLKDFNEDLVYMTYPHMTPTPSFRSHYAMIT